jgi:hypothetical protein
MQITHRNQHQHKKEETGRAENDGKHVTTIVKERKIRHKNRLGYQGDTVAKRQSPRAAAWTSGSSSQQGRRQEDQSTYLTYLRNVPSLHRT